MVTVDQYPVDLTYRDSLLTGSVGDRSVRVEAELPRSEGSATGEVGQTAFTATWAVASNYQVSRQPLVLAGTIGDEVVELNGEIVFTRPGSGRAVSGAVTGHAGDGAIDLSVTPTTAADNRFWVEGQFGVLAVELAAQVAHDLTSGRVDGSIGGAPVRIAATKEDWGTPIALAGSWAGPYGVSVLAALCVVYFM